MDKCASWFYVSFVTLVLAVSVCNGDEENAFPTPVHSRQKRDFAALVPPPKKLRVVTIQHVPFMNISAPDSSGTVAYIGFYKDILDEIGKQLNLEFELYPSPDGQYGAPNMEGEWTGMVAELMKTQYEPDGNSSNDSVPSEGADLALAALTISYMREMVVDFLHPLSREGLSVIVQKKYMQPDNTPIFPFHFGIFMPMSPVVWGFIAATVLVVASLLCLMNHFNPYEWGNRTNLGLASQHHKEAFNCSGSLWFAFSTMQWQGFERAPRSLAAKALTCFWFFFITITLVTYTGAFINNMWWSSLARTHNPLKFPLDSLEELIDANGKKLGNTFNIGCVKEGSTYTYVKYVAASQKMEFRVLGNYWSTEDGYKSLVSNLDEGFKRVRSEPFAMIAETLDAKYHLNKMPCDLTTVGKEFGLKSYAMAVPKNSPYRELINNAILKMTEDGTIERIERKWYEGQGECWNYTNIEKAYEKATAMYINDAQPKVVDLEMFWGVLVFMVAGIGVCLFTALVEILYYRYKGRYKESNRPQGQSLNLDNEEGNI